MGDGGNDGGPDGPDGVRLDWMVWIEAKVRVKVGEVRGEHANNCVPSNNLRTRGTLYKFKKVLLPTYPNERTGHFGMHSYFVQQNHLPPILHTQALFQMFVFQKILMFYHFGILVLKH